MQHDIRLHYQHLLDEEHHGHPSVVEIVYTGERGRPRMQIDRDFLAWAYTQRSVTGIARFLHLDRSVVRSALLEYGLAQPQENPFRDHASSSPSPPATPTQGTVTPPSQLPEITDDDLLDPTLPMSEPFPEGFGSQTVHPVSYTAPLSTMSDEELDNLVVHLRSHYRRAGISMLDGMLRRLGHHVQRERIRQSLTRIDPVQRVFERIRIRRRTYSVPGPNSLWHHDGQHGRLFCKLTFLTHFLMLCTGLIRWGIVIHGFIDGYSRLITGLRASNNNFAQTVFDIFINAAQVYGIPSRLRGDHGTENLVVALYMEEVRGVRRGSYIWGRSVCFCLLSKIIIIFIKYTGVFIMCALNDCGSM